MGLILGLGGLMLAVHAYFYWRLVVGTGSSRRWRLVGGIVLAVLFLSLFGSLATQRTAAGPDLRPLHLTGMTWFAAVIYLVLVLVLAEVVRLVLLVVRRMRHLNAEPLRRRQFSRVAAATAGIVAVGTVGFGMTQAFGEVRVVRATIALPDLPEQFEGYRIALATDLHLGPISGRALTQDVVDAVNREDVDMVALVGDLSDGLPGDLSEATTPLGQLEASDGVLFTTGNHEYYSDAAAWRAAMPGLQVEALRNAAHPVERGDRRLLFAGINDATGEDFDDPADLQAALVDRRPDDTVVLLAHKPRQSAVAAAADVDLQLSGHTHGGQFWPFHLAVLAQQKTLAGAERVGDTQVWTSRGAGFWGPPIRVGAPPDISILTLTLTRGCS